MKLRLGGAIVFLASSNFSHDRKKVSGRGKVAYRECAFLAKEVS